MSPRKYSVKKRPPPWETPNPKAKAGTSKKLTQQEKAAARRSAAKAGRKYPNLVDNMRVVRRS